ncbi:hypothetical protein NUW54_g8769 [Trametes sanguinea]|uniref:Uncharacterized protein n=1 Tax=Trametes sanguinea TaxID=158606 RepID=A0ACC1PDM2_9APHY|nr:hypothetical protein NUW54_g8769 [Trametes sanguinea]
MSLAPIADRVDPHRLIALDTTVEINCQALYTFNQITGQASSGLASINLSIRTMAVWSHHKKSVRSLAIHPTEYSFASGSAGGNNIKKWKCPEGAFVFNFSGHNAIINTLSVNSEGVLFSGGDNGTLTFWDYNTGTAFQNMDDIPQPGSLEAEAGVFCSTFDVTGTRLITGGADKTIKRSAGFRARLDSPSPTEGRMPQRQGRRQLSLHCPSGYAEASGTALSKLLDAKQVRPLSPGHALTKTCLPNESSVHWRIAMVRNATKVSRSTMPQSLRVIAQRQSLIIN